VKPERAQLFISPFKLAPEPPRFQLNRQLFQ